MEWSAEQRNDIINQAMDLCANVDRFRLILILTVDTDGEMGVIQKRRNNATPLETLGMYRLMAADVEGQLIACWQDNERPCKGEN